MSLYRPVRIAFWKDPKVIEEMTPEDKLFFLYLLTNPNTTQIGIYSITKKQMSFDLGYSLESISCILDRFVNIHKVVRYNEKTREIAIKNWGKYGFSRLGKPVLDCVKSELKKVNDISLIEYIMESISNETLIKLYKEATNNINYDTSTIGTQEKENKKEKEDKEEYKKELKGNSYGKYNKSNSKFKYTRDNENKNEKLIERPSEEELRYARGL